MVLHPHGFLPCFWKLANQRYRASHIDPQADDNLSVPRKVGCEAMDGEHIMCSGGRHGVNMSPLKE